MKLEIKNRNMNKGKALYSLEKLIVIVADKQTQKKD